MRLEIGPYPLDWEIIDRAIIRRSPGVMVLGEMAANRRTFVAVEVLTAKRDLKRTLLALADDADFGWFRCAYARSEREADLWARTLRMNLLDDHNVKAHWHGGGEVSTRPLRDAASWGRSRSLGSRR